MTKLSAFAVQCLVAILAAAPALAGTAASRQLLTDEIGTAGSNVHWPAVRAALVSEAPVQILQATTSSTVWEILGSTDGTDWIALGNFFLLEGEIPSWGDEPGSSERLLPRFRFVVGDLSLTTGEEFSYAVASVAEVGTQSILPKDSLIFSVYAVAPDLEKASAEAQRLANTVRSLWGLDVGDPLPVSVPPKSATEPFEPCDSETGNLFTPKATCSACETARRAKLDICSDSYAICAVAATVGFTACLASCPGTGLTCALCAVLYGAALELCESNRESCIAVAWIDYNACASDCSEDTGGGGENPEEFNDDPGSPIILDLDGDGFHLTGTGDPVLFDITSDGQQEWLSWTQANTLDAFLALDWDGNGTIDSGRELFGNASLLSDGTTAPHGYALLGQLDVDRNGRVDSTDLPWFDHLLVWIDGNHDGVSQPDELLSLRDAGVISIDVTFVENRRRDRYGNEFRYNSRARILWRAGNTRTIQTTDVFFVVAE